MKSTTLEKILEATKLLPENERKALVSELYVDFIAERNYDLLSTITKGSNIPFPEALIQQAYEKEAERVDSKMVGLYEATKIRPPEELIQKAYLVCIQNSGFLSNNYYRPLNNRPYYRSYNKFKLLIETFKSKPLDRTLFTAKNSYCMNYSYWNTSSSPERQGSGSEDYKKAKDELQRILKKVKVKL